MTALKIAWIVSILAYTTLLARIVYLGMVRTYPFISLYLALDIIANLVNATLPTMGREWFEMHLTAYNRTWAIVQPVLLISLALAVWKMFRRMCSHYRDFGWASSLLLKAFGLLAIAGAVVPLPIEWLSIKWEVPFVQLSTMIVRYCDTVLLLFSVCVYLFFLAARINAAPTMTYRPNVVASMQAMIVYIATQVVGAMLSIVHGHANIYNTIQLALLAVILFWWSVVLTPDGETWVSTPLMSDREQSRRVMAASALLRFLDRVGR